MTQHYIGVKQILAWEQEKEGKPGYAVKYFDGYISWSPKDVFEKAYKKTSLHGFTYPDEIEHLLTILEEES